MSFRTHGDLYYVAAVEELLRQVADLVVSDAVQGLFVVGEQILLVTVVVVDQPEPGAVIFERILELLDQVFAGVVDVFGFRSFSRDFLDFIENDRHEFVGHLLVGVELYLQEGLFFGTIRESIAYLYSVRAAFLLADGFQVTVV